VGTLGQFLVGGFPLQLAGASARRSARRDLDACYRALAERIRWDEANFDAFDLYDVDFSFRAHLAGYRVVVCPDISILHYGAAEYDQEWTRAARRFVEIHAQDMAVWNGQTPPWEGVGGLTREQARELLAQKDERPGE